MPTTLRSVTRNGLVWLVADTASGSRHWLYPQAKVGDCMRFGQRMTPINRKPL